MHAHTCTHTLTHTKRDTHISAQKINDTHTHNPFMNTTGKSPAPPPLPPPQSSVESRMCVTSSSKVTIKEVGGREVGGGTSAGLLIGKLYLGPPRDTQAL